MRPSIGLLGLLLAAAPAVLAQDDSDLPQLSTVTQPDGQGTSSSAAASSVAASTTAAASSAAATSAQSSAAASGTTAASADNDGQFPTVTQGAVQLSGLPTLAGVGVPNQQVPDTAGALFMQKSDLPDGTVFICVGAILGFLGACVLLWRGLVAWSLHRSVKRAALAQNLADMKAMSAVPGKKRGMYTHVGGSSTMSLDHLAAAPAGHSRPQKPFAQAPGGTPPRATSSLFFSPTAGGAAGLAQQGNRSSNYLPAGYYAAGTAAPAGGSPMAHVGGQGAHLSTNSLALPGNRFSRASGSSPPHSPSLPPITWLRPRSSIERWILRLQPQQRCHPEHTRQYQEWCLWPWSSKCEQLVSERTRWHYRGWRPSTECVSGGSVRESRWLALAREVLEGP